MNAIRKVLVVDDDPVVRKSFDRVLSGKGYAVITAETGDEALSKLEDGHYDVVYTDIRMPGMNGLDVAEEVKARKPWTPVVIITGYGTEESEARARAAGVVEFLHKPLSPDVIETSARAALAEAAPMVEERPVVAEPTAAEAPRPRNVLVDVALFIAAPFIGLAYIIAFPVVAMVALMLTALEAYGRFETAKRIVSVLKFAGGLAAAPFVGLAFIIFFPVIGLGLLTWFTARSLAR